MHDPTNDTMSDAQLAALAEWEHAPRRFDEPLAGPGIDPRRTVLTGQSTTATA
jgi:hypothetical protein